MKEIGTYWKDPYFNNIYKIIEYSPTPTGIYVMVRYQSNQSYSRWFSLSDIADDVISSEDEYLLSLIK